MLAPCQLLLLLLLLFSKLYGQAKANLIVEVEKDWQISSCELNRMDSISMTQQERPKATNQMMILIDIWAS